MRHFLQIRFVKSLVAICILVLLNLLAGSSWGQTNPTAQSLPYTQNFSSLTGTSPAYPAGWGGWTVAGSLSTSTIATAPNGDIAISTATNATNSRYVADITAKLGVMSTSSSVGAAVLAINTTGVTSAVTVAYTASTQGQTSGGRINELYLQYRVGTSGTFTNVTGATYRNNALTTTTAATTTASNSTTVTVVLPSECNNQSVVQLRWIIRDVSGSGNRPSFSIDDVSIAAATINSYYSKATGNLNTLSTWTTDSTGAAGTSPANFTDALQIFNLRNGNSGALSAPLTISGASSKLVVERTDLTIGTTNAITATIDVNAGRTLTIQNSTLPTLGTLNATSTVTYSGLSFTSGAPVPVAATYGNITFNNSSVALPTGALSLSFAGNFTLTGTSSFVGADSAATTNGYNLVTSGTADQIISANGNNFFVRNLDINNTSGSKSGKVTLSANTNMLISNSLMMNISGAANQFSDGGNTLKVFNNVSMGGDSLAYNLTGTLYMAAPTGATSLRGYSAGAASSSVRAVPVFNNLVFNNGSASTITFQPSAGPVVYNVKGNFAITGSGTGAIVLGSNTINIGGNFIHTPTASRLTTTGSTVVFNGTTAQSYSSSIATAGNTFVNVRMNNASGLTLNNPMTISGALTLTSGKINTGSNALLLTSAATVTGASSTSYVNGALQKTLASGTTSNFYEVGNATSYAPVKLTYGTAITSTTGSLTVRSTSGDHPNIATSSINTAHDLPSYYTITTSGLAPTSSAITADFSYASADISGAACNTSFIANKFASSAWSLPTVSNTTSATAPLLSTASTVTGFTVANIAGDYAFGSRKASITSTASTVLTGGTTTLSAIPTGGTWSSSDDTKATVSASGVVYGVSTGTLTITYSNTNTCGITSVATQPFTVSSVPQVTSLSAISGNPGQTITISGNNFPSDISKAVVYFGTQKTAPLSSGYSTTSMSVNVPYGAMLGPVYVVDTQLGNVGASGQYPTYNILPFVPKFDNTPFTSALNFKDNVLFTVDNSPLGAAIGDLDGDGKLDLVVNNVNSGTLTVLKNVGTGTSINTSSFTVAATLTPINANPNSVRLLDMDGDGFLDVVATLISGAGTSKIQLFRNTTSGGVISFSSRIDKTVNLYGSVATYADFDGDGKLDIAVGQSNFGFTLSSASISVVRNASTKGALDTSSYANPQHFGTTTGAYFMGTVAGDFDNDGKPDIAAVNLLGGNVSVIRNTSSVGSVDFSSPATFTAGSAPVDIQTADIDGDGKLDLVVTNQYASSISILKNESSGSGSINFTTGLTINLNTTDSTTGVALADFTGDGKVDIAVSNPGTNKISIFKNASSSGSFVFEARYDKNTGSRPLTITAGDLDNDGFADVVVGLRGTDVSISNQIAIFENYPIPSIAPIGGTTTVCVASTTTLTNITTGSSNWWILDNAADTVYARINATTGVVTGVSAGSAIVRYYVVVGGDTSYVTATVTVNPLPVAGTIIGEGSLCVGGTTTFTNTTYANGTLSWSTSNAAVASITTGGVVSGVSLGVATITSTITSTVGCGTATDTAIINITSSATVASISGDNTVCQGATTSLSNLTAGGTWSSTNTSVATIDATGVVYGIGAGTTTISYSVSSSCGTAAAISIMTVTPLPATPSAIAGASSLCAGSTTTLSNDIIGGVWTSSNSSIATVDASSGVVYGVASGTTTITYAVVNSCGNNNVTKVVTVNDVPVVSAITGTTTVCEGSTTTLSNLTIGGTWSSANISVATVTSSGVVSGVAAGTTTITYQVTNTCGTTNVTTTLNVISVPASPAAITGSSTLCQSANTTLSSATADGVWSSADMAVATVDASGIVYGVSGGTTTISYGVTNSCGTTYATKEIVVNALPALPESITGTTTICALATTTLSSATVGGTWSSSAMSVATVDASGVVYGVSGGSSTISYTVTNACGSTAATTTVTVLSTPVLSPISGSSSVCLSSSITLSNSTSGGTWSSTNTSVATVDATTGVVYGVALGSTSISYTVTNICGSATVTRIMTVVGTPYATITGTATVSAGSSTNIYFAGSANDTVNYNVNSGANQTIALDASGYATLPVTLPGTATGTYVYTITSVKSQGGCIQTITGQTATITVGNIYYNTFDGGSYNASNTTYTGGATGSANINLSTSTWKTISSNPFTSLAGVTGNSLSHSIATSGTTVNDTLTFTVASGYTARIDTIKFSARHSGTGHNLVTVYVNGTSLGATSLTATTGSFVTITPTMTPFTGLTGTVTIRMEYSGGSSATGTTRNDNFTLVGAVSPNAPTIPSITSAPTNATVCSGSSTTYTVAATGSPTPTYQWQRSTTGTGGTYTNIAAGTDDGIYSGFATNTLTVTPTISQNGYAYRAVVTNTSGSVNSTGATLTVNSLPVLSPISGASTLCVGSSATLSDTTSGGTWVSSNTAIATIDASGIVYGVASGSTTISYQKTSSCGTATVTTVITVNAAPTVASITGTLSACEGTTTTLSNTTASGVWSSSNTAIATVDASGVVSAAASGTTTISYTVTNTCGATASVAVFTVNPSPAMPASITGTTTFCLGLTSTLANAVSDGVWSSSNTAIATVDASGVVYGSSAGTTTISYTISNTCGSNTATAIVTILDAPVVGAISGPSTVCVGSTVTLTDTTAGGVWSSSDAGILLVDADFGYATAMSVGSATVTYTKSSSCGDVYRTLTINTITTPVAAPITGTTTVCTGYSTTLSGATGGGEWTNSASEIATVDASGVVYGVAEGTTTISYSVTNSCGTGMANAIVTVNGAPAVGAISGMSTICFGSTRTYTDTTMGGVWSSSNPEIATIDASGVATGVALGFATISYTYSGSCGTTSVTLPISVITTPTVSPISGDASVCAGGTVSLSNATTGGVWSSTSGEVATVNASGVVYATTAGTTTISYTVINSCGGAAQSLPFTVLTTPVLSAISGTTSLLLNQIVTLSNTVSGGTWSSSASSVATISSSTGVVTAQSAGTTTITYTATNTCGTAFTVTPVSVANGFGTGNIIVFKSTGTTNGAAPITMEQYSTSGTLVSATSLPSTGAYPAPRIVCSGSATSEGMIALDSERVSILIPGYDTTTAITASVNSNTNVRRTIFRLFPDTTYTRVGSVTQAYAFAANNIRSATAAGNKVYGGGAGNATLGGIVLMGTSTASPITTSPVTNVRNIAVYDGQLYMATGSGTQGIYKVGSGLPSTSSTGTILVGTASSPYGFAINPAGDTLYVADDNTGSVSSTATTGGGIKKYYKNTSGVWTFAYNVDTLGSRGLTVDFTTKPYTIYATSKFSPANILYKVVDNGAMSTRTVLATAGATQNFRGVALAPASTAKITATTATVCSGNSDSIIIYGNPGATVAYTQNGTPLTTTIDPSGRKVLAAVYTNTTTATVTNTFVLTSVTTSIGTFAVSGSATITVNPATTATITGPTAICSGSTASISVAGGLPGATVTVMPGSLPFVLDASGNGSITVTPSATTTYTATVSYLGCSTPATGSVGITVNPLPTASISGSASVYSGASTTLTFSGTPSAKVYYTSDAGVTTDSITIDGSGAASLVVSPVATTTYSVTAAKSAEGCLQEIIGSSATITVTTMPVASISGTATICSGVSTSIVFNGNGAATVRYTTDGGATIDSVILSGISSGTGSFTLTVTPTTTTTYTLLSITSGEYTGSLTGAATVTVVPTVTAGTISGSSSICSSTTTTLSSTSSGGTWFSSATAVATISPSGVVTAVSVGSTTISYIVSNTCFADTAHFVLTVNPLPTISVTGSATISSGSSTVVSFTGTPLANFNYTVNGGAPIGATLSASGSYTLSVTPTVTSIYSVTSVTSIFGCSITPTASATVTVVSPFTAGNLALIRVGNGSATLNSAANQNAIVEYTTSGVATGVSVVLPSTGTGVRSVVSGSATSEGMGSLDSERTHFIVTGYDTTFGTASVASAAGIRRSIFSVLPNTLYTAVASVPQSFAFSGNNIRSATAAGNDYYASGANSGVMLMGTSTATNVTRLPLTNTRSVQIFNGQIYYSASATSTGGIYKVGNGTPTDSTIVATRIAVDTSAGPSGSPYGFSISPDDKTLYIADDQSTTGGILKYTRASSTDMFAYAYRVNSTLSRGITVDYTTVPYTIYATTTTSSVIKVVDNGASSTATTIIASAGTNYAFRGIQFTPASYAKIRSTTATVCTGNADSIIIYANPGATVSYTANGVPSTAIIGASGMGVISTGVLTNATAAPISLVYKLNSVTTSLGTYTMADSTVITVNNLPYVSTISGFDYTCPTGSITLAMTESVTGGVWSTSDTTVARINPSTGVLNAVSAGAVTISYALTNSCGTSVVTNPYSVNATPTIASVSAVSPLVCTGNILELSASGASGSASLVSYNWSGPASYSSTTTDASLIRTVTTTDDAGVYSVSVTYSGSGCTSSPVATTYIPVYQSPVAYTVTGADYYCGAPVTIGLSGSDAGVSYQLYRYLSTVGSAVSGTGSSLALPNATAEGIYSVVATSSMGCVSNMSNVVTLTNHATDITLGANPAACQPLSNVNVSYSLATGTPTTYNISWSAAALSAGFTNVSDATLGAFIPVAIPSGVTGVYTPTITVSNGYCTSTGDSVTISLYAQPLASITSAISPCVGRSTSIIVTGTSGAEISYSVDGGAVSNATLVGGSYTYSAGILSTSTSFTLINAHNFACSNTVDTTVTLSPIQMYWTGTSNANWSDSANWTCGFPPTATDDVFIPSGTTYMPIVAESTIAQTKGLVVMPGAALNIGNDAIVNVSGTYNNYAEILGNGKVRMAGSTTQAIAGTGYVNNIEINNTNGVFVAPASKLNIKKNLIMTSGTLSTNDSVVLWSDSVATARIAPIVGGNIAGNVIVQQYMPGGRRAYRFLSHPFSTNMSLTQLGDDIDITGSGGALNGFTTTGSNAASAFWYNPLIGNSSLSYDPGWRPITSLLNGADSNDMHQYQGMRIFYRGAKGEGMGYASYTPSATVISMKGLVNQGTQVVHMQKGTAANQDYNLLGNPYASPVDIGTVAYNAKVSGNMVGAAIYVWNPYMATSGNFQAIPVNTVAPTPYYIQAGAAFEIRAAHNNDSLVFTENNKGTAANTALLKSVPEYVSLMVYDANNHPWDMAYIKFDDNASAVEESDNDAKKIISADFSMYTISDDKKALSIDARPYNEEKVIPLGINSKVAQQFTFKVEGYNVPSGATLYLHDKLKQQYVELSQGATYSFGITSEATTQGDDRFEITMKPADVKTVLGMTISMTPNPATEDVTISFNNAKKEDVKVRLLDMNGVCVYNNQLGMKQSGTITIPLSNFATGMYMVELTSGKDVVTKKLVKE